ncbi:hypothetical protein E5S70_04890 [Ensifer adhaerens]|uniref:hypothetical protein n=1 Tax=Ensifer canadensis TaxID=555315 RepID=UPI00148F7DD6|nr:hypothetical protein [Ensifer canadensis]NOV15431.1 hypothetical protein [Ensifer canadensis]
MAANDGHLATVGKIEAELAVTEEVEKALGWPLELRKAQIWTITDAPQTRAVSRKWCAVKSPPNRTQALRDDRAGFGSPSLLVGLVAEISGNGSDPRDRPRDLHPNW